MNKNVFMGGILLVVILLLANTVIALTSTDANIGSVNPGESISGSSTITNDNDTYGVSGIYFGVTDLTGVTYTNENISSSAVSFSSVPTLVANGTDTVTVTVAVPENLVSQAYRGTVTINGILGDGNGTSVVDSFLLTVVVLQHSALDVLTYDATNALRISGQEDSTRTGTFSVKNTGNVDLSSPSITNDISLSDSDGNTIILSFSDPGTITAGDTATVTATAVFPNSIELDTYIGNVTVTSGTATDSFKMNLVVQPEVCENGIVKDGVSTSSSNAHLDIDLKEPGSGDDIKPGEPLEIEVKVKNGDDEDHDVVVEAFLYNLDDNDEIASVESDTEDIEDGDTFTFDLELEIPKSSDLDVGDNYILYVKAYEDGDEDENCNEESVSLDLKRDKHDTVVKDLTITPSTADCGESIEIRVDVENQGTRDEDDVYIVVKNNELGLNLESNKFDLDKYSGKDEDATKRFNFNIPSGTVAKDYIIEAIVYFDDGDKTNSEFETLKVRCADGTVIDGGDINGGTASLSLATDTQINTEKDFVNLHLIISNSGNKYLSGSLGFTAIGGWAGNLVGQPVSLHPGDNNLYLPLNLKDAKPGMNSATVSIKPIGTSSFDEKQFTLNFDIKDSGDSGDGEEGVVSSRFDFLKGKGTAFWVVIDLVLIIVALVIIKAVFSRKEPSL